MKSFEEYTEFQKYVKSRFDVPGIDKDSYFVLLLGPEQYEVEPAMIEYVKKHPDASIDELVAYFNDAAPDGLPPCASEWEDDEDDDDDE